jgi:carboxymethylenebutenolidase
MSLKSLLTFTFFCLFFHYIYSQNSPNCCLSSTKQFAQLGEDISFVISHQEPLPFTLSNPKGIMISFQCDDNELAKAYYIKGSKTNKQYIFVIHEWYGLNDYIKQEADKLAESFPGTHILALDMYDGKVAGNREDASKYMQALDEDRAKNIILGATSFTGADSKIATLGWCFGGAWSLKIAILLGNQVNASIMYYGMPVNNEKEIAKIEAPVLGLFANEDKWITPKIVKDFENLMKVSGKDITVHSYDAIHGFANPSNAKFDLNATNDAWLKTIQFLKTHTQE